jgi:hypothetical protein
MDFAKKKRKRDGFGGWGCSFWHFGANLVSNSQKVATFWERNPKKYCGYSFLFASLLVKMY